jgi:hypothetical protein
LNHYPKFFPLTERRTDKFKSRKISVFSSVSGKMQSGFKNNGQCRERTAPMQNQFARLSRHDAGEIVARIIARAFAPRKGRAQKN